MDKMGTTIKRIYISEKNWKKIQDKKKEHSCIDTDDVISYLIEHDEKGGKINESKKNR